MKINNTKRIWALLLTVVFIFTGTIPSYPYMIASAEDEHEETDFITQTEDGETDEDTGEEPEIPEEPEFDGDSEIDEEPEDDDAGIADISSMLDFSPFSFDTPRLELIWIDATNTADPQYSADRTSLIMTPEYNTEQRVVLHLTFSLPDEVEAEPGEIEILVPRYIFETRDGSPTGTSAVGLSYNIPAGTTGFYYTIKIIDGVEYYAIKNYEKITYSQTFVTQIPYTYIPAAIENEHKWDGIAAAVTYPGTEYKSNELDVTVNTSVKKGTLAKTAAKFESWQPSWGPAPADAGDNYYIVWSLSYYYNTYSSTQPYSVTLTDEDFMLEPLGYGNIVGYSANSTGAFAESRAPLTFRPTVSTSNANNYRYAYVLTQYPRSGIPTNTTVKNNVHADVWGDDNKTGTPDHELDAQGIYTYALLRFTYGGNQFLTTKTTAAPLNNSTYAFSSAGGAANKLLGDGTVTFTGGTSRPYTFAIYAIARGYGLTLKEGGDAGDPNDYGHEPYKTELSDDIIYLKSTRLEKNDYSFKSFYLEYRESNYLQNLNSGAFVETLNTNYAQYGEVEYWYKTADGGDEYILGGTIKKTAGGGYTYTGINGNPSGSYTLFWGEQNPGQYQDQYVGSGTQVPLPAGAYDVKFVHTGAQYQVQMQAYLTMELHPTEHVKGLLEDGTDALVTDVNTLAVRDSKGAVRNSAPASSISGTAFWRDAVIAQDQAKFGGLIVQHATSNFTLRKFNSSSFISKVIPSGSNAVVDDIINGIKTVNQTVTMYEICPYTPANLSAAPVDDLITMGIFNEQLKGTFYDLLPPGCTFDNLAVRTYGTNAVCPFSYYTVENWQGSGRTMLVVDVTAPTAANRHITQSAPFGYATLYSGFILTFRLINPYTNIVDNGNSVSNLAAYRTTTENNGKTTLKNGTTAPITAFSGVRLFENYFQNLSDPSRTVGGARDDGNNDTIYSFVNMNFTNPVSSIVGISKRVMAEGDTNYTERTSTIPNGRYTYQLRYANGLIGTCRNMVFYDVLENIPDPVNGNWKGSLVSVDTSFAAAKGIAPKVYYSTGIGLDPHLNPADEIGNGAVWTLLPLGGTAAEITAVSGTITAIAIDLSKKTDGSDYIFNAGESIFCLVNMLAPAFYDGEYAVNRICYTTTETLTGHDTAINQLSNPTYVKLRDPDFNIGKKSDPPGTPKSSPGEAEIGGTIEYTISVTNRELFSVSDVEVVDVFHDCLAPSVDLNDILFYTGTNESLKGPLPGRVNIDISQDGKTFTIAISSMAARETVNFVIPAEVAGHNGGAVIANKASVTKFNGAELEEPVDSNETYHIVEIEILMTGSLTVYKELDGDYTDWAANPSTVFPARVKIAGTNTYLTFDAHNRYTGTSATGSYIQLRKDSPVTLEELPINVSYLIEEVGGSHYTSIYAPESPVSVTDGETAEVTVTNVFIPGTNALVIEKVLGGSYADWGVNENTVFRAYVYDATNKNYLKFPGGKHNNTYRAYGNNGDEFSWDGADYVEFTAAQPVTIEGLWEKNDPSDTGYIEYRVIEVVPEDAKYTVSYAGNNFELPGDANHTVTVTNTFDEGVNVLNIQKVLAGSPGDWGADEHTVFRAALYDLTNKEFLQFPGGKTDNIYTAAAGENGDEVGVIEFTAGQPVTIKGLQGNCEYKIIEFILANAPFSVEYSSENVFLPWDDSRTITVTNTFRRSTGNLIIEKRLEGTFDFHGVTGDDLFYAQITDVDSAGGETTLLFEQTGPTTFWCVGNHTKLSKDGWTGRQEAEIAQMIEDGLILDKIPFSQNHPSVAQNLWESDRMGGDPYIYNVTEVLTGGAKIYYDTEYSGAQFSFDKVDGETVDHTATITNTYIPGYASITVNKALAGYYTDWAVNDDTVFMARI